MALTLIPIGTEERQRTWPAPAPSSKSIICRYNYFYALASDLGVASDLRWYVSSNPDKEVAYEDIKKIYSGSGDAPNLTIWQHYSLLIVLGVVILFMMLGF
jgi:hypothetical protein